MRHAGIEDVSVFADRGGGRTRYAVHHTIAAIRRATDEVSSEERELPLDRDEVVPQLLRDERRLRGERGCGVLPHAITGAENLARGAAARGNHVLRGLRSGLDHVACREQHRVFVHGTTPCVNE